MYHIKRDKRALASVELICAGLLRLMARKPFEKITITDLQKESTVSRSTFYRNFDCLEDVLELLCDRGFQTIFVTYNAQPPEARGRLSVAVFRYWCKNSGILEPLVAIHRTDILFSSLRRCAAQLDSLQFLAADPVQYDYFVSMITSVMVGILVTWTEHGKAESEEKVLEIVKTAFAAAVSLGIII